MSEYFEGWYYKHQKDDMSIALIPGRSKDSAFIQVITNHRSYNVLYGLDEYRKGKVVCVGSNRFNINGIELNIHKDGLDLSGSISYKSPVPIAYDIMGPFRYLPMECRHTVLSMYHGIRGNLNLNGQKLSLDGGKGYIEGDSGKSFPESYTWVQSNDFDDECSVMVSIAKIPFAGLKFLGCIGIVWYRGKEYRLATYKGVKIQCRNENRIELTQRGLKLTIEIKEHTGHSLYAPDRGSMSRTIHECVAVKADFTFSDGNRLLFKKTSDHTSYEYVE